MVLRIFGEFRDCVEEWLAAVTASVAINPLFAACCFPHGYPERHTEFLTRANDRKCTIPFDVRILAPFPAGSRQPSHGNHHAPLYRGCQCNKPVIEVNSYSSSFHSGFQAISHRCPSGSWK